MAYLNDAVLQIRVMINDLDEYNYTYSDSRLKQLFLVSSCKVLPEITSDNYTIDLSDLSISPEPNKEITNLILLKAVCLLTSSEAKSNTHCNVKVIDGPSTIHLDGIYKSMKEMSEDFCQKYEKAKVDYLMKNSRGYSSITPTTVINCCNK